MWHQHPLHYMTRHYDGEVCIWYLKDEVALLLQTCCCSRYIAELKRTPPVIHKSQILDAPMVTLAILGQSTLAFRQTTQEADRMSPGVLIRSIQFFVYLPVVLIVLNGSGCLIRIWHLGSKPFI